MTRLHISTAWLSIVGVTLVLPASLVLSLVALDAALDQSSTRSLSPATVLASSTKLFYAPLQECGSLSAAAWTSFERVLLTLTCGACLGAALGVLLCALRRYRALLMPTIDFVRAIPITFLLIPMTYAIGLIRPSVPWVLATVPCTLLIAVCVADGGGSIDKERARVIRALFLTRPWWHTIRHLYVFELFAGFVTGLRLAVPYTIILIGVLEFIGAGNARPGLGFVVQRMSESVQAEQMVMLLVLIYGAAGLALVLLSNYLCRHLIAWHSEGAR